MCIYANIEPLYWENEFFNIESAILRFKNNSPLLTKSELLKWSIIQAKIPTWQIKYLDSLQIFGFKLVESEIELSIKIKSYEIKNIECEIKNIEIANKSDIPYLRRIATMAFSNSRFRAPWYNQDEIGRFYAQWIENAVLGIFDNICLIYRNNQGEIQGFISLRLIDEFEVRIGLLAGKGIGKKLIKAALYWSKKQKLTTLRITTQISNIVAIKHYINNSAKIEKIAYWLYKYNDSI